MIRRFLKVFILGVVFASCTRQTSVDRSHEALSGLPDSTVVLELNGKNIIASDIEAQMRVKIEKARDQIVSDYRNEALEHAYQSLLLETARTSGATDVFSYLNDLKSKIEISDSDTNQFLKKNKITNLSKEQATKFLIEQRFITLQNEMRNSLLSQAKIEWRLLPTVHNITQGNIELSKGAEKYNQRLDVFCDFTNLLCAPIRLGVEQALMKPPKDLRVFFHPLPRLKDAVSLKASLAAICAGQIHQFWKAYDSFFNSQAKLVKVENLDSLIHELTFSEADQTQFENCMKSGEAQKLLDSEIKIAKDIGITESPAILLGGAQTKSIEEALEKMNLK